MTGHPAAARGVLPEFRLETYLARWEFRARYHVTASDAQTMTVAELLDLAGPGAHAELAALPLGYTPPQGGDRLRAAIAAGYAHCGPDDILVFAGAEEGLYWAMRLLAGPGDHVVVTVPNYQAMETVLLATGADVTGVALDPADGWRLDVDAVRAALRPNTRLVAVNFPNNPTGAVPDRSTWAALVELCESRGVRLFADEVYRGVERDPDGTLPQAADVSPGALSLNAMAKAYGLPGLRIGWIACRDRAVLRTLERHRHYTSICSAGPSELLAAIALEHREAILARTRAVITANLPLFGDFFARHADLFEFTPPDGGCVAFPRYLGADGAAAFCRDLVETAGVLLLPADIYRSGLAPVPMDRFRVGLGRTGAEPALAAWDGHLRSRRHD